MTYFGELACAQDPELFDQIDLEKHKHARKFCLDCDHRELCRDVAKDPSSTATGTFGGDLFQDGRMIAALGVDLT